ncbi:Dabb family protein [Methylomonas sp. MgM2]
MKRLPVVLSIASLFACTSAGTPHREIETHRLHHLVVVWLKQAGDETIRRQYIEASRPLAHLPGVLAYDIGTPALIKRGRASSALDESYDIAVAAVFESPEYFTAFLKNPEYQQVAINVLRPLVEKYKVYDFVE